MDPAEGLVERLQLLIAERDSLRGEVAAANKQRDVAIRRSADDAAKVRALEALAARPRGGEFKRQRGDAATAYTTCWGLVLEWSGPREAGRSAAACRAAARASKSEWFGAFSALVMA